VPTAPAAPPVEDPIPDAATLTRIFAEAEDLTHPVGWRGAPPEYPPAEIHRVALAAFNRGWSTFDGHHEKAISRRGKEHIDAAWQALRHKFERLNLAEFAHFVRVSADSWDELGKLALGCQGWDAKQNPKHPNHPLYQRLTWWHLANERIREELIELTGLSGLYNQRMRLDWNKVAEFKNAEIAKRNRAAREAQEATVRNDPDTLSATCPPWCDPFILDEAEYAASLR
jgi:hypothetical protein